MLSCSSWLTSRNPELTVDLPSISATISVWKSRHYVAVHCAKNGLGLNQFSLGTKQRINERAIAGIGENKKKMPADKSLSGGTDVTSNQAYNIVSMRAMQWHPRVLFYFHTPIIYLSIYLCVWIFRTDPKNKVGQRERDHHLSSFI